MRAEIRKYRGAERGYRLTGLDEVRGRNCSGRGAPRIGAFAVLAVLIMAMVGFVPMLEQADSESAGAYWTYTINQDGTISGNYEAIGPGYAVDRGQYVSSKGENCGSWGFDDEGYGPFGSFYAAFDPSQNNKMVCHLDPNNLKVSADGKTDITGKGYNVMWCLPTVYWKADSSGNLILTNNPDAGGVAYAHTIDDTTYPYLAIGVYEASTKRVNNKTILTSDSGQNVFIGATRQTVRDYASNQAVDAADGTRTDGSTGHAMLWNFYQFELYKYCAVAVMGGWNSQGIAGNGAVYDSSPGSSYMTTGLHDGNGPYAGTIGSGIPYIQDSVKVFLENVWGSVFDFVDGIIFIDRSYYISQAAKPADTTKGDYSSSNPPKGYNLIPGVEIPLGVGPGASPSNKAETWGMPTSNQGSRYSGFCDDVCSADGVRILLVGGFNNSNSAGFSDVYGLSYSCGDYPLSGASSVIGGRLAFVFDTDPAATVKYDHSDLEALLEEYGYSENLMSGLSTGKTITKNGAYDKLPDIPDSTGFRHVGWIVDGKEYLADQAFFKMSSHTAKSVWVGLPAVTYDHSKLVDFTKDPDSVAGLSNGLGIKDHSRYEQLPSRDGYAHTGWRVEIDGKAVEVGPTDAFVTRNSHTAISLWTVVPTVVFDHSNLTDIVGTTEKGVSDLVKSMTIEGNPKYPQLPDTAGYRHYGWEIDGSFVGPTAALVSDSTHSAKSLWEEIVMIPIFPDEDEWSEGTIIFIPEDTESWFDRNGKSVLLIAVIIAIIAELAALSISRTR